MNNELSESLGAAHSRLRSAVERASVDLSQDIRVMSSHEGDNVVERYLCRGVWVELIPELRILLIDDRNDGTRALVEGKASLPKHYHTYNETLLVLEGDVLERTTGRVYYPGTTVEHPTGEVHEPEIRGLCLVVWRPPLPIFSGGVSSLDPLILHLASKG